MAPWALLAMTLTSAVASPASACSPPWRCGPVETSPSDGATDVPTNVELEAYRDTSFGPLEDVPVELRIADTGESIPVEPAATPGRWRATGGLAPLTRYELLGPPTLPDCPEADTVGVLATFVTGESADEVAPSTPTTSVGACYVSWQLGSTCGSSVSALAPGSWSATDDRPFGVVYAFGSPQGPRLLRGYGEWARTVYAPYPSYVATFTPIPAGSVFAIDAAGNVSEVADFGAIDLSCAPSDGEIAARVACDGGICSDAGAARHDAGASADADARTDASPHGGGGGCNVARRARSGPPWLLALAACLALARHRARARVVANET